MNPINTRYKKRFFRQVTSTRSIEISFQEETNYTTADYLIQISSSYSSVMLFLTLSQQLLLDDIYFTTSVYLLQNRISVSKPMWSRKT